MARFEGVEILLQEGDILSSKKKASLLKDL